MRAFVLLAAAACAAQVTPVQKVIELLSNMAEKGKAEKHQEQVQFAAYKQFCDDTSSEKEAAIVAGSQQMELLAASIQKATADAATLTTDVGALEQNVAAWEGDKKAAIDVRSLENADYLKTHKDYSESVDALERAIVLLKKRASEQHTQAALTQLTVDDLIPEHAKQVLKVFLAQDDQLEEDPLDVSAPEAAGYEFQSQGVIDMLEKLHDKFEDERTDLEKEESNARHAHEMLVQDLTSQITAATGDRESKTKTKASKLQSAAEQKGTLTDTTAMRDSDQTYLTELVTTCRQKSTDFEARQQLRADELAAIEKAVEVLSSNSVAGAATKHLPALTQVHVSLVQLSAANPTQKRVAAFLRAKSEDINSRVLSALAVHVEEDPFVKVKKMIKDLIVRLMEEANEEAEHKGWCDTELTTNEHQRKEKSTQVDTLHSEIDGLAASISKLTQEISDLAQEIVEIDASVAKETELRNAEHATNTATITESQGAQTAVAQAVTVLKEFYASAADSTALLQQPDIFDSPYTGMQAETGGVVGMLEVIQSDFARLETDTKASEAESLRQFNDLTSKSAVNRAQASKDVEHKTTKRTNEESNLSTKRADLEGTQKELDAALAYYDKLKPSCVDAGVSYDERVSRRREEIESLQEALRILNGEDLSFLQH